MIDKETAVRIVCARLREQATVSSELALDESQTVEFDLGWIFFYNSRKYLETKDFGHAISGNVPFIVDRHYGIIRHAMPPFASAEQMIANFRKQSIPTQDDPLANSIWWALHSTHFGMALISGKARCYPLDVAPFASVDEANEEAMSDLSALLARDESVYLLGNRPPDISQLRWDGIVTCLQMIFPPAASLPTPPTPVEAEIEELDCTHADEMMELIAIAFPAYFREQTCHMGHYFGIRHDGRLVAMGGERLLLEANGVMWREISGLCTHPEHTGSGYGTALLLHIIHQQRAMGAISWLHVVKTNRHAIDLYNRLGFETLREVELHRMVNV